MNNIEAIEKIGNEAQKRNDVEFKKYDKITIKITPLHYENKFNKKLNIKILNRVISIM